jgi:hypothetical protein
VLRGDRESKDLKLNQIPRFIILLTYLI